MYYNIKNNLLYIISIITLASCQITPDYEETIPIEKLAQIKMYETTGSITIRDKIKKAYRFKFTYLKKADNSQLVLTHSLKGKILSLYHCQGQYIYENHANKIQSSSTLKELVKTTDLKIYHLPFQNLEKIITSQPIKNEVIEFKKPYKKIYLPENKTSISYLKQAFNDHGYTVPQETKIENEKIYLKLKFNNWTIYEDDDFSPKITCPL